MVLSGLISVCLGLFVVFNLVTATPKLLGILIGAQMLIEAMTLLIAGRVHYLQTNEAGSPG